MKITSLVSLLGMTAVKGIVALLQANPYIMNSIGFIAKKYNEKFRGMNELNRRVKS